MKVYALHDVCIESHPKPWVETKAGSCPHRPDKQYNINRRIVVYNSPSKKYEKDMSVGGHGNRKNNWEIFYETGPPPKQYKYADYPALFVTTSCEAVRETVLPLYSNFEIYFYIKRTKPII
jgi:hypothetical protein